MTHDYTRKRGVVHTEILLPPHAPPSFSDRATLWNSVELYEKAGNAQLAREIDAALPIELSREEQIRLVREYCSSQFVSRGMCVDFAIHDTDSGKPASLEELLRLLEQDGFTVHRRGKNISIGAEGWGNNVRFDRLGDGYTLDDLLAVLSGQKEHTPRKQAVPQAAPPKVNLLVDIQAKLQAGKGAGYARWAKVFNLKQMAQTLNYLSEHGLLDYADLETKTAEATARYNALSDQIKAAEKRMAEIAVLRTHIVNYAKTRETYVAYRKAGYSKKFRQEHEEEILLHQAAKEAFNELNVKKLPTIKELQTEYAQLLADKKKAYGEYRQARATMRELLTVKNNVDRVLAMEQTEPQQKEKDHGQR